MKSIITFRFTVAIVSVSLGCYALLAHWTVIGGFFASLPVVVMSRSEMVSRIPSRPILVFIGIVFALEIVFLACRWCVPLSVATDIWQVLRHPAFVFPFWMLLLGNLYWIYRREREQAGV